jgi:hypothetical protein
MAFFCVYFKELNCYAGLNQKISFCFRIIAVYVLDMFMSINYL